MSVVAVRYIEDGVDLTRVFEGAGALDKAAAWSERIARREDVEAVRVQSSCDHDDKPAVRALVIWCGSAPHTMVQCADHARRHDSAIATKKRRDDDARWRGLQAHSANLGR